MSRADWRRQARIAASLDPDMPFEKKLAAVGLDPARDLRHGNWSSIHFRKAHLGGCDFSGSELSGARLEEARITGARFDGAILGRVIHRPGRDPHAPAEMTAVADLREAADWGEYVKAWQPSPRPPTDAHLPVGAIFSDAPGLAPEMVVVPAGTFMMGSSPEEIAALKKEFKQDWYDAEGPQHEVTISAPFAVGRFTVTFEEWAWAQEHPDWKRCTKLDPRTPDDEKWSRERRPVIDVSWDDATAYCTWLSQVTGKPYRLLSEAEWEYCCRAGTTSRWWFGNEEKQIGDYAWYSRNSEGKTHPVGEMKSNAFGLHDMHGNVWEWCEDNWHENYKGGPPDDGSVWSGGDASLRVLRGGSWDKYPQFLRSADRYGLPPDVRFYDVGFRLARTLLAL